MAIFRNSFDLAFARAVPFFIDKFSISIKNIADSLTDKGIFIGKIILSYEINLNDTFIESGSSWVKIIKDERRDCGFALIIAGKNKKCDALSDDAHNIYKYVIEYY